MLGLVGMGLAAIPGGAMSERPRYLVGYSEIRTNLPGRHANTVSQRACLVRADGRGRRMLATALTRKPNTWSAFTGWSPDGRQAIIGVGWESPENGAWEQEHGEFRFSAEGWLLDSYLLDLATGKLTNLTAVGRVSCYNYGTSFWPGHPGKLLFTALVEGSSHPWSMDLDGRHKRDLSGGGPGYIYGVSVSPDGKRMAYHKDYQVYVAAADGSGARHLETGNPFNFCPTWSPDGRWLVFVSGEHYDCHPYLARPDGTELRRLASRGGYRGVVAFLDVPDFHGGSSDVPVWSPDSRWVYYTARVGEAVELMRASPAGEVEQLTHSAPGVLHYHPSLSPDGRWLLYGSNRDGVRQLYVARADGRDAYPITHLHPGRAAMWAHWQPVAWEPVTAAAAKGSRRYGRGSPSHPW